MPTYAFGLYCKSLGDLELRLKVVRVLDENRRVLCSTNTVHRQTQTGSLGLNVICNAMLYGGRTYVNALTGYLYVIMTTYTAPSTYKSLVPCTHLALR